MGCVVLRQPAARREERRMGPPASRTSQAGLPLPEPAYSRAAATRRCSVASEPGALPPRTRFSAGSSLGNAGRTLRPPAESPPRCLLKEAEAEIVRGAIAGKALHHAEALEEHFVEAGPLDRKAVV